MSAQQHLQRVIALLFLLTAGPPAWTQSRVDYNDWRLEWAEEFNQPLDTAKLAERWRFFYPWGRALQAPIETGYYTGEELRTANGVLNMTAHKLAQPIVYRGKTLRYTTAMLFSRHFNDSLRPANCNPAAEGFGYGLFEARVQQPREQAMAPAFWLYGGVPDEIDIFETSPDLNTNNFHLYPGGYWRPTQQQPQSCQCAFYNTDPGSNLSQQFHTYGVSWMPDGVVVYFDGVPIRHETRLVPAGCPMSLIINLAVINGANAPTDTMKVDYIRVYRPKRLPAPVAALPAAAYLPQWELAWLPAITKPGQPDQATYQVWELLPQPRRPRHLSLQLTDNFNPACTLPLPLPLDGQWAPAWLQMHGVPELRVRIAAPDSVSWTVRDALGQTVAQGTTAGGSVWRPQWPQLPPGTYSLQLQQGQAATVHPLYLTGRPAGSAPSPAWGEPRPRTAE